MTELLLLSNSTNPDAEPLAHAPLAEFYEGRTVHFVPYALADHAGYTARLGEAFARAGVSLRSVHTEPDPAAALASAEAVWVGGGNTFRLLTALQALDGLLALRTAVQAGVRYGGASAGTNLACPTIRTTNDMPIVEPAGFDALGLLDFQVNPHYLDPTPGSRHMGETRAERIAQFHEENEAPVVGLREGGWLRVSGDAVRLTGSALVFRRGEEPEECSDGLLTPWAPRA
ncbi:dipeptidase PepE [Pseudonocardia xishanensis]|uniref:Dipeptidase PepE n=1 Tax=Pseudonocardia xishanensis TaxID=630995 RepID=A0ABP8RH92_9PSEU